MSDRVALMSADEAAAYIGCCEKTLGRLRRAGLLHFYKTAGRGYRYSKDDCDAYLDSCRTQAQPAEPKPQTIRRTAKVIPLRPRFSELHG